MKLSTKHLFFAIAALAALVLFYAKTNGIRSAEHERFDRSLRRLQQLDATVNQDVLKARFRLLNDYDSFPDAMNELKRTAGSLAAIPSFISDPGRRNLREKVNVLSELFAQKDELLENFKSQNAVLNNSLSYFSVVGSRLISSVATNDESRELEEPLNELTRQVLAFSLNTSEDQTPAIALSLEKVDGWRQRHRDAPQATALASLVAHANSIVNRKPTMEALTGQLMAVPTGASAEELLRLYEDQFAAALRTADLYRRGLYTLCALLVLGIGYTIYALNMANARLELRSHSEVERSSELARVNAELQAEIVERQRAQKQLTESESRQRLILESQPECVKQVAADGSLLYMNPAGLNMVEAGHLAQVLGHSVYDLVAPEYHATFRALNEAVFQGESRIAEFEIIGLKGTRRWMETHACPLRDTEGNIMAQLAVTRDVSERKKKEEELRRTQALLNSVVENLPMCVFIKEAKDLRFVMWNKAGEERTGHTNAEMVGKNDYDFFPREEADRFVAEDRKVLLSGKLAEVEEEVVIPHNGKRILHTRKIPILDDQGQPFYLLGISEDITERKRAEAELEKAHKELLDASRQAGMAEVATGVLHNVGNVLNSVNVSATLVMDNLKKSKAGGLTRVIAMLHTHGNDLGAFLAGDPKGKQLPSYLERLAGYLAHEQSTSIKELELLRQNIEHIKDIVAMQQSYAKVSGVLETVKVTDLIEDALRMNSGALVRHDVQLIREYDLHAPDITVEKHKVLQILVNLIRNAKYACDESGSPEKRLTVRVTNGDNRVRIAVADNGVGILAENLTRIFSHGFTTRKDGHGFGLHSGALAARELGGSLIAQSEGEGLGATFILELPVETNPEKNLCKN